MHPDFWAEILVKVIATLIVWIPIILFILWRYNISITRK